VLGGFHLQGLVNFRPALASGLVGTLCNILYGFSFVPLCLAFLPLENFGLWALMLQLVRYLDMLDVGVSGAVFRLFSEANQSLDRDKIYNLWTSSLLVQGAQGAAIFFIGILLLAPVADFFKLNQAIRSDFFEVSQVVLFLAGIRFALRPFGMLARSHHLHHRLNLLVPIALLGGLAVLFFGLNAGWGMWALAGSFFWEWLFFSWGPVVIVLKERVVPALRFWRFPGWLNLRRLFVFGSKLFLVQLSILVTHSMPLVISSRMGGLEAGAVWAIGSRVANLIREILTQIDSAAAPGIFSVASRQDEDGLKKALINLAKFSLLAGSALGAMYAIWNHSFVALWTEERVNFSILASSGLAVFLMMSGLLQTLSLASQARLTMGPLAKAAMREVIFGPIVCWAGWIWAGHAGLAWGQVATLTLGMLSSTLIWFFPSFGIRPASFFKQVVLPSLVVFITCFGSSLFVATLIHSNVWIIWCIGVVGSLLLTIIILGLVFRGLSLYKLPGQFGL